MKNYNAIFNLNNGFNTNNNALYDADYDYEYTDEDYFREYEEMLYRQSREYQKLINNPWYHVKC